MLLSDVANLGDKIDIQLVQQIEQQHNGELNGPIRTYKSSLFEFVNDKEIEIGMPTENGRMVLFQIGLRCQLMFYTKKGLYICTCTVQKRFKKDNFFVLLLQLRDEPKKFQRREFYRVNATVDFDYMVVGNEFIQMETTREIYEASQELKFSQYSSAAITVDISGGGMRFASDERLMAGGNLLVVIRLSNDKVDQTFFLVTQIIESVESPKVRGKYITRGKFLFKDLNDREEIVRFVFEEERRIRRKEMA